MSSVRRLETPRLVLELIGLTRVRRLAAGELDDLRAAPGWPANRGGLLMAAENAERDEDTGWLVVLRKSGEVIGDCGWKGGPGPYGDVEIGYGLSPAFHGQGYGTEAVGALVSWCFGDERVRRVVAVVHEDNVPSRRLLERLGFTADQVDPSGVWYHRARSEPAPAS